MYAVRGEVWEWRGPAPYHFVTVPPEVCEELRIVAADVTYGWGMIPVEATIGSTTWETSLWARAGGYVVPIKDVARRAEGIELGDVVQVSLVVATRGGRLVHDA